MALVLTTARNSDAELRALCRQLAEQAGATYVSRSSHDIEKMVRDARYKGFTSLAVLEKRKVKGRAQNWVRALEIGESSWSEFFAEKADKALPKLKKLAQGEGE